MFKYLLMHKLERSAHTYKHIYPLHPIAKKAIQMFISLHRDSFHRNAFM